MIASQGLGGGCFAPDCRKLRIYTHPRFGVSVTHWLCLGILSYRLQSIINHYVNEQHPVNCFLPCKVPRPWQFAILGFGGGGETIDLFSKTLVAVGNIHGATTGDHDEPVSSIKVQICRLNDSFGCI